MQLYRLLGPLTVERDGVELDLGTPKQRAVLAVLAQDAGATVSADRLLAAVWGDRPPGSAVNSLHVNISRLRSVLRTDPSAPSPIVRRGPGYRLETGVDAVDVQSFTAAADAASAAVQGRDWAAAVTAAETALGWWRGAYLEDLRDEDWVRVSATALDERRSGTVQDLLVGLLGIGDLSGALARSTIMIADQPLVERAAWLHMVALHRSGRSGEALQAYRDYTDRLDAELGLDVGPALRDLQASIFRQDDAPMFWPVSAEDRARPSVPGVIEPATPVVGPAPDPDDPDRSHRLVGRVAELSEVRSSLAAARTQRAVWVVLAGPAGIGKTRLAERAAAEWVADGGLLARGQCPDLDDVPGWWPIRQVLRDLAADPDDVLTPAPGTEPDAARYAVVERVADTIRRVAAGRPLLIVLEDIHWADRESLTLLSVLAEALTQPGLALLLTTRRASDNREWDALLEAIARRPGSRQLDLNPFGPQDVADLVQEISGDRPAADDIAGLIARTGGSPFYVAEYARLPPDQRRGEQIPAAVRTVLRRRFAALPADVLAGLRVAAVLGDPLDVDLVAAATDSPPAAVADIFDTAADLEIVTGSPDGSAYMFSHALLQAELTADVPDLRRQRWHLAAADRLTTARGPQAIYRRARHLHAAGPLADPETAVGVFVSAATAADRQWSNDTAATWWSAAVTAHDRLSDPDPHRRDELVTAAMRAMAWGGQYQGVLDTLDTALIDTLRAGHTASVGRLAATLVRVSGSWPWPVYGSDAAPLMRTLRGLDPALRADPGARARVLAVRAIGECYHPDPRVPDDLSRRAVELAEGLADPDVLADTLLGRALTYAGVASRSEESVGLLNRLAELDHTQSVGDEVLRHNVMTMATLNLGRTDDCAEHVTAGAVGADVLRMSINRVQLRWAEAALAQWSGDLHRARGLYAKAELAHRSTDLQQAGTFEIAQLVMLWDQGRLAELDGAVLGNPLVARWMGVVAATLGGRPGSDAALVAEVAFPEPEVWTSHGRWVLLAHCVVERGLVGLVPPLLDALAPVRECLAAFGQVGVIGPVALAMAKLFRLDGRRDAAREHLQLAIQIAVAAKGPVALLHCRAEAAVWDVEDASAPSVGANPGLPLPAALVGEVGTLVREAERLGLSGVADRLRSVL